MTTFNYMCIKDDCNPKTIQSKDKKAKCEVCGSKLKKLGISTSILHKGTQEALNKMKR